ncbi:DUF1376 domain-containing protein [Dyella solisilvae]|uniref:DUF1376 domain-containing protein n=1 Tax=Dyella solisilvae TaxID=1920168 RepID=A0A370K4W0_9GAMM|nr:DUF1376 domain-containing protein [Dyella solisilvae]RDI97692.1 DUF1376 domain-containing protein [Dyella solisilvae]
MKYFPFWISDYLGATGTLSPAEHGIYLLLLTHYFRHENGIEREFAGIISRARTRTEKAALKRVLAMFFTLENGVCRNARAEDELAKYRQKSAKNTANAQKRWQKDKDAIASANAHAIAGALVDTGHHATPMQSQSSDRSSGYCAGAPAAGAAQLRDKGAIFTAWKALPDGGGGGFVNNLLREHKPEARVLEALAKTLAEPRNDPKAYVLAVLRQSWRRPDDPLAEYLVGVI